MFNKVILMGRLTKDPEIRTTQTGIQMCRFSIACERRYSGNNGEKQTDFFDVTAWRQIADFVCKYFSKGKMILVEGSLQNNNYTDNNGVKHYSTAIIAENVSFTGDKSGNQNGNGYQQGGQYQQYQQNQGYQNNGYQQQPQNQGYGFQMPSPTPQQQQFAQQVQQFQQNQQMQQPVQAPQSQPNQNVQLGDLNDFDEILSDGNVPF